MGPNLAAALRWLDMAHELESWARTDSKTDRFAENMALAADYRGRSRRAAAEHHQQQTEKAAA